ncbi:MAG: hypothetical protein BGP13_07330 [Sphingobacteriales bacterium 40-81]|nr:MAG: hypothetical protein BGP13_07330 [Sphingobacteriales bacterium 40-81]
MLLCNQLLHQYAGSKFCLQYIHTSGQGGCINRYGGIADIRLAPLLHYLPITIDQFKTADAVKFTASVLRSMVKILLFDSTAVA